MKTVSSIALSTIVLASLGGKALAFCEGEQARGALYRPAVIDGLPACSHAEGYALYFSPTEVPRGEAKGVCAALGERDWFLPSMGDIAALSNGDGLTGAHRISIGASPPNSVPFWYASIPKTGRLSIDSSLLEDRTIPLRSAPNPTTLLTRGESSFEENLSGQFAHYCMAALTPEEIKAHTDDVAFEDVQAKGVVFRRNGDYYLRETTLSPKQVVHFYTPEGTDIFASVPVYTPTSGRNHPNNKERFFGIPADSALAMAPITAEFPTKAIRIDDSDAVLREELSRVADTGENVLLRGALSHQVRTFLPTELAGLGVHSVYEFSFCYAETAHFRTTRQGCLYFEEPGSAQGRLIVGRTALDIYKNAPALQQYRTSAGFTSSASSGIEDPVLFASPTALIGRPNNGPGIEVGCRGCASRFLIGYAEDAELSNEETAGHFFQRNGQGPFATLPVDILLLRGAAMLTSFFPQGSFPDDLRFSFAQQEQLVSLRNIAEEFGLAHVGPTSFNSILHDSLAFTRPSRARVRAGLGLGTVTDEEILAVDISSAQDANLLAPRQTGSLPRRILLPARRPDADGVTLRYRGPQLGNHRVGPGTVRFTDTHDVNRDVPAFALDVTAEGGPNPGVVAGLGYSASAITVLLSDPITAVPIGPVTGGSLITCSRYSTNPVNEYDVNADGTVSALDALVIINALGREDTYEAARCDAPLLYDVNASGTVSALDALEVINALGRRGA